MLAIILFFCCFLKLPCYQVLNSSREILVAHERLSSKPLLHIYYDRHFLKSKQFDLFLTVLQQVENTTADYCETILTDCQQFVETFPSSSNQLQVCSWMRSTKDNRAFLGYIPDSNFVSYGDKKLQVPPKHLVMDHQKDIYTVNEIREFIDKLVPNYFQMISTEEEFQAFKLPKYSPKLIFAARDEEDVPLVIKKISVHFFLRFDFAQIDDLTPQITNQIGVTDYPKLLVYRYNFYRREFQIFAYPSANFEDDQFHRIKAFLGIYSLIEYRNDYIFHKTGRNKHSKIVTVSNEFSLELAVDQASSEIIVLKNNGKAQLIEKIRDNYGQFYKYIHFTNFSEGQQISIYRQVNGRLQVFTLDQLLSSFELQQPTEAADQWLNQDYVVMGVHEKHGHLCSLTSNFLFRSILRCFMFKDSDVPRISQMLQFPVQVGFVCSSKIENGKQVNSGRQIMNSSYDHVYDMVEFEVRLKMKSIVDIFFAAPVKKISANIIISELCINKAKLHVFAFIDITKKDRTIVEYLKEIASRYIKEYSFYEVDASCNKKLLNSIPNLNKNNGAFIVYHPMNDQFASFQGKATKSNVLKFLSLNINEPKKLIFEQFYSQLMVRVCQKSEQL